MAQVNLPICSHIEPFAILIGPIAVDIKSLGCQIFATVRAGSSLTERCGRRSRNESWQRSRTEGWWGSRTGSWRRSRPESWRRCWPRRRPERGPQSRRFGWWSCRSISNTCRLLLSIVQINAHSDIVGRPVNLLTRLNHKGKTRVGKVQDSLFCLDLGKPYCNTTEQLGHLIITRTTDNGDLILPFLRAGVEMSCSVVL